MTERRTFEVPTWLVVGVGVGVISACVVPFLSRDVYVQYLDFLDGIVPNRKALAEDAAALDLSVNSVPLLMGGHAYADNKLALIYWLTYAFGPFGALGVGELIMRAVAFVGAFVFLRDHVIPKERLIALGVATCFALLPFWRPGMLGVPGQPLVAWAFLNIRGGQSKARDYVIVAAYGFCSNLFVYGLFFYGLLALVPIYDRTRRRPIRWATIAALASGLAIAIGTELRVLATKSVLHRVEYDALGVRRASDQDHPFKETALLFLNGQWHANSLHKFVILPAVILALAVTFRRPADRLQRMLRAACLVFLAICTVYLISILPPVLRAVMHLGPLRAFTYNRGYTLFPLLTVVAFATSLVLLRDKLGRGHAAVMVAVALHVVYLFANNTALTHAITHRESRNDHMTFRAFYAEGLFARIRQEIARTGEGAVVSVGMYPSIALYNGLPTVDGYSNAYDLSYKHQFRRIIARELARQETTRAYFDGFGSRCYVYDDVVGKSLSTKASYLRTPSLDLDWDELRAMGGRYLLSAAAIERPSDRLRSLGVFEDATWKIALYEITAQAP